MITYHSFRDAHMMMADKLKSAPEFHGQRWQGVDVSRRPEAKMVELLHESFQVPLVKESLHHWQVDIRPNLPWADDHFQERICGYPVNPGIQWAKWPWGNSAKGHLEDGGIFNHNYMERYWPKFAGQIEPTEDWQEWTRKAREEGSLIPRKGIRYEYGDLFNLVEHLIKEPDTRQAYLPIFFPEDTGTANPTRKPCTLGYHLILRNNQLHITYYMRSCDFHRHWADDCYLTVRLLIWILQMCRFRDSETWGSVKLGLFTMHITSLHMFINDARSY